MSQGVSATQHDSDANARRKQIVTQAVREISHIATLPEITIKIIEIVEDPDSTAHDLHMIIANDPALCARVLKVVNSAFYGLPGQIGSINRAIVLLGLNAVKNIAIAASLARLFRGGRLSPSFSAKDLWAHSIAVAATTKLLAEKAELRLTDEAFLAGLMHDIGIMVEMQTVRPKLVEVIEDAGGEPFLQAEQRLIGATHQDFGRGLCESWKFPRSFACVTGYHHHPLVLDREMRTLTTLVHIGDILAARSKIGFAGTVASTEIASDVLDDAKLADKDIQKVMEQIPEAYTVADQLLA
ncbi:MAG: HDOD domain-containing protein [Phycisphaeraceae bacterium]